MSSMSSMLLWSYVQYVKYVTFNVLSSMSSMLLWSYVQYVKYVTLNPYMSSRLLSSPLAACLPPRVPVDHLTAHCAHPFVSSNHSTFVSLHSRIIISAACSRALLAACFSLSSCDQLCTVYSCCIYRPSTAAVYIGLGRCTVTSRSSSYSIYRCSVTV